MREIKFRAWDKIEKRMWWNVQDAYDTLHVHHNADPETKRSMDLSDEFMPSSFGCVLSDERYSVMQYTGLKDKNGKEIYEGDIVEVDWNDQRYQKHNVEVIFNTIDLCWEIEGGCLTTDNHHFEIIGNVYENPNLL